MMQSIPKMDIKEFREFGYLQEVNRLFFHPLGLALEITVEDDGSEYISGIWDCRDDPEGVNFAEVDNDKGLRVASELLRRRYGRKERLGYIIQPLPCDKDILADVESGTE